LDETANILEKAGWALTGYHEEMRNYNLESQRFPGLSAKVFHEKDIPIQVSVGNYDLGICGLDWVEELLVKYPSSAMVKLRNLGCGEGSLYVVASQSKGESSLEELQHGKVTIRIASEYPNLAEAYALKMRLRRFSIFPLWGAAEVYPPENAELALIPGERDEPRFNHELVVVGHVLDVNACLIANRDSWEKKDLGEILASIGDGLSAGGKSSPGVAAASAWDKLSKVQLQQKSPVTGINQSSTAAEGIVRLALPDGHQQKPTLRLLNKAGLKIDDYPSASGDRRPVLGFSGVTVKVIRPQDMPLQVANGNFDLAITGRDWLAEHRCRFLSSPVEELLNLKFGRVKLVAVVSHDLPVDDIDGLKQLYKERAVPIRIASEYFNLADRYARDNHLGMYRVIPTWGASEAFLPDDADLLIENTETGTTIARHNLKIIDTLFQSTACLIGNQESTVDSTKEEKIKSITETLRSAV